MSHASGSVEGSGFKVAPNADKSAGHMRMVGSFVVRGIQFGAAAALLAFLSYLFGHDLREGNLVGKDAGRALPVANWYNHWFPAIPIWFPLQGAGTHLAVLHPPSASLIVVGLHRMTGLTLVQSFRSIGLISVTLTSITLFTFLRFALKSWSAG